MGWRQTKHVFFPQNPVLYNGSRDGYIRTCDVRLSGSNWPVMCLSQGKMASVTCLRELHDENYLLSSGLDGSVRPCIHGKKIKERFRPIFSNIEGTHCTYQWYCNVCISIFYPSVRFVWLDKKGSFRCPYWQAFEFSSFEFRGNLRPFPRDVVRAFQYNGVQLYCIRIFACAIVVENDNCI